MDSSFPSLSQGSRAFPLPSIPEDTLRYGLHLPSTSQDDESSLAVLISDYVQSLLIQPWLWNKDAWELKPAEGAGRKLEGRMRVGDAVDDEWLVVWLLREVSKRWKDLVISIRDTDGEFLLIEAANELPAWVSPENAENRVWLKDGHLHLVPLSIRTSTSGLPRKVPDEDEEQRRFDPEAYVSEEDGIAAVRTGKYKAEKGMESAVWDRIACYPEAMNTHQHRTKAWIPEPVARALSVQPDLIQKAVEGFYVRDPAQLRAASRMTHFPPAPAVLSSVLMTRAAYAQLQGQVFHPPRIFGPEWHAREGEQLDAERSWRDLGVKIATGFEIMYREGGRRGRSGVASGGGKAPGGVDYDTFIANLKRAGFFGTELQGSEQWKKREEEAVKGWNEVRSADVTAQRPSFAYLVDQALAASIAKDATALQASTDAPEDSDSWLEVSPDELDGMMQRASGQTGGAASAEKVQLANEDGQALGDLAKKVEEFVGGQGDMEGARFIDELSDDDDVDDDDNDEDEDDEMEDQVGAEQWDKLAPEDKAERMRNLVAPLDEADWGRKDTDTEVITIGQPAAKPAPKAASKVESEPKTSIRPPIFEKQHFDGVESDSDDEMDEADLPPAGTLGRKIAEMRWGDMGPSIEEIEDDEVGEASVQQSRKKKLALGDDIDEQMRRKVWGAEEVEEGDDAPIVVGADADVDVDMGEEEEEFIKFTREALVIDEEMWDKIVSSRKERGAFVPERRSTTATSGSTTTLQGGLKSAQQLPAGSATETASPASAAAAAPAIPATSKAEPALLAPASDGRPNTALDSFDKVMAAMDAELARVKAPTATKSSKESISKTEPTAKKVNFAPLPGLPLDEDLDDLDDETLEAMDRELKAALKNAGVDEDDDDDDDDDGGVDQLDADGKREYEMMKNFLESYRSQGGTSGAVGNLFGRLGGNARK